MKKATAGAALLCAMAFASCAQKPVKRTTAIVAQTPKPRPPISLWNISTNKDAMTDEVSYLAQRTYDSQAATINISCSRRIWEFFLLDKSIYGDGFKDAQIRFDEKPPMEAHFIISKGTAGVVRDVAHKNPTLDQSLSNFSTAIILLNIDNPDSRRLRVRLLLFDGRKDYDFDLIGASDVMQSLKKHCQPF